MSNYIKSELYRFFCGKRMYRLFGVVLGLIIAMVLVLAYFGHEPGFSYDTVSFALGNVYNSVNYLLLVVLFLAAFLDDNESKQHTKKHSVAYGISRTKIFFSRFLSQGLICLGFYITFNLVLVVLSYLFLENDHAGAIETLIRTSIGAFPLFLAALATAHCFIMNIENVVTAEGFSIGVILILPSILNMLGMKVEFIKKISYWFPYNLATPFLNDDSVLSLTWNTSRGMLNCYIAGILFMVFFLLLGRYMFEEKEIK